MWLNQFKTVVLLGILTAILLFFGNYFGGRLGLTIALIFVILMNFGTYWFSDKVVLTMYRAIEINDKNHALYRMVREVSELANVPMPKVYIIPTETPNAFATGRSPKKAAVATTNGILKLLNAKELKGVIAHEIAHVKNRDTLIATIATTIAGIISYLAFMARFAAIFGGMGRNDNNSNLIGVLVLSILTPIIATIIQLAISRSREYIADERGARFIQDPEGLASALEKLESGVRQIPLRDGNQATASLFIVNPFRGRGFIKLFSTHPATEERCKRLRRLNL